MNFRDIYYKIAKQRESIIAPVDKFGLIAIKKKYSKDQTQFLMLVSLLLSSQTKDIYNFETIEKFVKLDIVSFSELAKYTVGDIKQIVQKIGFANKKSLYLKELAEKYKNKAIPTDFTTLTKIKGIGPKMAILYLNYAENIVCGVGVDTHIFRVCNRLGMNVKTANECEKQLCKIFDKSEWKNINYVLVGFGQEICKAKKPNCHMCSVVKECKSKDERYVNW
ncbi:hypothetical protein BDAP_001935 [Binucleata daphniae]